MESDWKKFAAKLDEWRERYLTTQNARLAAMLLDESKSPTERFWDAKKALDEEARTLRRCLDEISRSKMWLNLLAMRSAGMIQREDLREFSEELQRQVFEIETLK